MSFQQWISAKALFHFDMVVYLSIEPIQSPQTIARASIVNLPVMQLQIPKSSIQVSY